jgi:copper oxidase (laccase) domain-containing protein
VRRDAQAAEAFHPSKNADHWMMDICQLARLWLNQLGVDKIYGGDFCTYFDQERFYSYRRENCTGRMTSLIWR